MGIGLRASRTSTAAAKFIHSSLQAPATRNFEGRLAGPNLRGPQREVDLKSDSILKTQCNDGGSGRVATARKRFTGLAGNHTDQAELFGTG